MIKVRNTRKLSNYQQIGAFQRANLASTQTIIAMTYQGVAASDRTSFVAGFAGSIIGVAASVKDDSTSGGIVAGTAQFDATVAGTVVGQPCILSATAMTRVKTFTSRVDFAKGDKLGIKVTSADLFPIVNDYTAWLMINWNLVGSKAAFTATS